jgi:hypothetical protein
MPYTINKTNGTILTDVLDNSVDRTTTDVALVGKSTPNYGEYFNENFIKLLENFANSDQPRAPLKGQLWYDTGVERLKIYNGVSWKDFNRPVVSTNEPVLTPGEFWINPETRQLYFNDGTDNTLAGPIYTAQQGTSGFEVVNILDTDGYNRTTLKLKIGNFLVGVFAKETFTPNYAVGEGKILASEGFNGELSQGFNILSQNFKYNGTALNAENLVQDGVPINVGNFVQTTGTSDVDGRINLTGNNKENLFDTVAIPVTLGYAGNLSVEIDQLVDGSFIIPPVKIKNNITNQDLALITKNSSGSKEAIFIDASSERVGIFNNDPLQSLDINGNLNVRENIVTNSTSISIVNTTATIVNLAGEATEVNIGANSGETTVNNNLVVEQDLTISGQDLIVTTPDFNLANTTVSTINFGQSADTINIGSGTGAVNFAHDINVAGTLGITGDMLIDDILLVDNKIRATGTGINLELGSFDGDVVLLKPTLAKDDIVLEKELRFDGENKITITPGFIGIFEVLNDNVNNIAFGGEALSIVMGSSTNSTSNTTIRNNLQAQKKIVLGTNNTLDPFIERVTDTVNVFNQPSVSTLNIGRNTTQINIGNPNGLQQYVNIDARKTTFSGDLVVQGAGIETLPNTPDGDIFNTGVTGNINIGNSSANIYVGGTGTTVKVGKSLVVGSITGEVLINSVTSTSGVFKGVIGVGANTAFFDFVPDYVLNMNIGASCERIEIGDGDLVEDSSLYQPSTNTGPGLTSQLPVIIARQNFLIRNKLMMPELDTSAVVGGAGVIFKNINQEIEASTTVRLIGNSMSILGDLSVTGNLVGTGIDPKLNIPNLRVDNIRVDNEITTSLTSINVLTTTATTINLGGAVNSIINLGGSTTKVKIPGYFKPNWKIITSSPIKYAQGGEYLLIDNSSANVQVYLPPHTVGLITTLPEVGDTIYFMDRNGLSAARPLYLRFSGEKFNGAAVTDPVTINTPGIAFALVYTGTVRGWCYLNI